MTMILIAPILQIGQYLVGYAAALVVGIALLDVVDTALIMVVDGTYDCTERVWASEPASQPITAIKAASAAEVHMTHCALTQLLVTAADICIEKRLSAVLGSGARNQIY